MANGNGKVEIQYQNGAIKQQDFVAISKAEECDIMGIRKCGWCNVWKPDRDMLKSRNLFGVDTCTNCYYNFMKMTKELDVAKALSLWISGRILKTDQSRSFHT